MKFVVFLTGAFQNHPKRWHTEFVNSAPLNTELQTVSLRPKQAHVKRRQDYGPSRGDEKRRRTGEMGNLRTFPSITEECFLAWTCPVPEARPHRIPMAGIENSAFPEQVISLPNPNLLEPLVTMKDKKLIFNPDADGNNRTRDDSVSLEKPDVEDKQLVPLSLMGRDRDYIENKLWLVGASQIILWGVGNGMWPWVCLRMRIPILCIYGKELHKDVIEKHILEKIMVEADKKSNQRFYKSDTDLGVEEGQEEPDTVALLKDKKNAEEEKKKKAEEEKKKKAEEEKKKAEEKKKEKNGKNKSSSSSASEKKSSKSSSSSSSSKKKKDKKAKKPTKKA